MIGARKWLVLFSLMAAALAAIWLLRVRPAAQDAVRQEISPKARIAPLRTDEFEVEPAQEADEAKQRALANAAARKQALADWQDLLRWLHSVPAPTEQEITARLLATRIAWVQMDPRELADMIRQLLNSGTDAETGLTFQVGLNGLLTGWPTLRVFLLDVLATADPEMAAEIASNLLDLTTSPDEFAVGLRSLTRPGPGRASDEELVSRLGQMLDHPDWQQSRGFAEAFDLARAIGSNAAAQRLASFDGNPALKQMALHEFAAERPDAVLEALEMDTSVSGSARASLMARANPQAPAQVASVDQYLRDPLRTADEANEFLKLFPLRSATTGYRLYAKTPAPYDFEQITADDRAALGQVDKWLVDPTLTRHRPDLLKLQSRLKEWISQAAE